MIIVEGPDNAGKTTLIRQLLEEDPTLRLLKRERFKPGQTTIGQSYLQALFPSDGDRLLHANSLADRLVASECIYGELFRGGCRMSPTEHEAIRLTLLSYLATVIHCDVSDDTLMASWTQREQLYDNPLEIAQAYRKRLNLVFPSAHVVPYSWESPDAVEQRATILSGHRESLLDHRDALAWWSTIPYGIGNLHHPRILLLTDATHQPEHSTLPLVNESGHELLMSALQDMRMRVTHGGAMDMYVTPGVKGTSRDAALLREELSVLVDPKYTVVISLGREVHQLYTSLVPTLMRRPSHYMNLPHPANWTRDRLTSNVYVAALIAAFNRNSPEVVA